MRHLVMCAVLALVLASCATPPKPAATTPQPTPQASDQCIPLAMLRAIARAQHVEMAEVQPVAPFLAALNRLPPPSDYAADQVYVLRLGNAARLILAEGGCAREMVDIPWGEFLQMAGEGA